MKELNPQTKGTYFLCLSLPFPTKLLIGKLGEICFKKGFYLYVGKAFGPGGLKSRIKRHLCKNSIKRWHIDYLKEKFPFVFVGIVENKDVECKLAQILNREFEAIEGFGSSDCKCHSHLFYSENDKNFIYYVKKAGIKSRLLFHIN